jgi:hypothetical protein
MFEVGGRMINWCWPEVDQLEQKEDWNEARDYMYNEWKKEKLNLKKYLRLSFLCWYIVVESGCLNDSTINDAEYEYLLMEIKDFGFKHFSQDSEFLWVYGYMISLFPYYFGEYEEWEEKGNQMIYKAYKLNSQDPIVKYIYIRSFPSSIVPGAREIEQVVNKLLPERFKGNGQLQSYFKEVLHER